MDKEVLIHVRGLQTMDADGEQEPLEIVVPGQYYFRNGSHYLRYEEVMEDFAEPTVNYIKISRKGMEVRKKGVVNVHMVFEQGKKNMTYYTTPYGTIEMGIAATNLNLQESDGGLYIVGVKGIRGSLQTPAPKKKGFFAKFKKDKTAR